MGVRYHRAADLLELTGILQTTVSGLSIDEIAARFEVSRRTAERMLGALRERFPDLEPVFRSGRKYWKLPQDVASRPLRLPKTVDALGERLARLEDELRDARAEAEELRGIADGVLDSWQVGILVIDSDFRAVWANHALFRCLELRREEIVGQDMRSLVHECIRHRFDDPERFSRRALAPPNGHGALRLGFRGTDGRSRWIDYSSRPITAGRYAGGRVDQYAEVRSDACSEHPAAGSSDGRSLGATSGHRTPAQSGRRSETPRELRLMDDGRAILGDYLTLIREAAAEVLAADDLSPAVAERLRSVVASSEQSVREALSLMDRGQMKFEPTAVPVVLRTAAALVEQLALESGVHLELEVDEALPRILADRTAITSAVTAAARNAILALEPGRTVRLRAERLDDPPRIRMSILDDGPDMPDSLLGLEGRFTETARSGLGLGITRARDATGRPIGGILQYFEVATEKVGRQAYRARRLSRHDS